MNVEVNAKMSVNDWILVADNSNLQEGSMIPVFPLGIQILLARVDVSIYALSGKCAHNGRSLAQYSYNK